jgi:hypothetical protein
VAGRTAGHHLPQFAGVDIWGRSYAPKSAAAVTPVTTAGFPVEIMRFPHVFGLRLSLKMPSARRHRRVAGSRTRDRFRPA